LNVEKIAIFGFVLIFSAIGIGLVYGAIVTFQDGETTKAFLMLIAALAFESVSLFCPSYPPSAVDIDHGRHRSRRASAGWRSRSG
jgi:hypothetical protein